MAENPFRKKPGKTRPKIWASGGQRPPFDLRALGRATLRLSRDGLAPIHAWAARAMRRAAVRVRDGGRRLPAGKLGRVERFVPSHRRVAAWIANLASMLAHASATADPDTKRGNALVAEIEPYLWEAASVVAPAPPPVPAPEPPPQGEVAPVVLKEPPQVLEPGEDPLASIRGEFAAGSAAAVPSPDVGPEHPPAPPGPKTVAAIQVLGYLLGWASIILALPVALAWALWLHLTGRDLRQIGRED